MVAHHRYSYTMTPKLNFKPPLALSKNAAGEFAWPSDHPVASLELDENLRRDIQASEETGRFTVRGLMVQFCEDGTVVLHGDRSMDSNRNANSSLDFGTVKLPDGSTKAQTNLLRVRLPNGDLATLGVIHKRNDPNAPAILKQPRTAGR